VTLHIGRTIPPDVQRHHAAMQLQSPRRSRLALEITVVLVVKFTAMAIIWTIWFSDPPPRPFALERMGAAADWSVCADAPARASHARP